MQSARILARYLDDDKKKGLAVELSQKLDDVEAVNVLYEIIDLIDEETLAQISPNIAEQCKHFILEDDEESNKKNKLLLLKKIPPVYAKTLDWITSVIISSINSRLNFLCNRQAVELFKKDIQPLFKETSIEAEDLLNENLLKSLDILLSLEVEDVSIDLDKLICFLLTIQENVISTHATKLLRWRDVSIQPLERFVFDLIPCLLESNDNIHVSNGYILWLRFLTKFSSKNSRSEVLDNQLRKEQYWKFIQRGMGSTVHEHRKFCLSILKLSIQQMHIEVDNELMFYSKEKSSQILEEWKKYCTLFEIVGIDTALNQAEAAKSDIHQLLSPDSFVKSSWGLVLLSTGFKGSMESVRKFALNIMLSCSFERLPIYAHPYLTSIFLRYAVEAPHFQVKKLNHQLRCDYGLKLETFIALLLKSLRSQADKFEQTVTQLLELLVDVCTIFAPARVYLTLGLLKGLKGTQCLDDSHAKKLFRLFESTAEDQIFENILQTTHLKLLMHLKPNIHLLLEALTKFVQFNGYGLYNEHVELFHDYIARFYNTEDKLMFQNREIEFQIVAFSLFDNYILSDEFLIQLATSKLDITVHNLTTEYSVLLTSLVNNTKSDYTNAVELTELDIFKNSWRSVDPSKLYKSILAPFDIEKFEFFVKIYAKITELSDVTIITFNDLQKLYADFKGLKVDYKVKDRIFANYFSLAHAFMKMTPLSEEQVEIMLSILDEQASCSFYLTNIATCNILDYLFINYDFDFTTGLEILDKIWYQISAERLVLNQKNMHVKYIETLFNERVLKDAINNEYNAKIIKRIGLELIEQAFTRRSFLPTLTSKILNFQRGYKVEFDQSLWLIELLLKSFCLVQDETNLFRLKPIIAKIYDNELKFHGDLYQDVYGTKEVSAKINVINILLSSSVAYADEFFESLITDKGYSLLNPSKKANGIEERERISTFALLLLVTKKINSTLLSSLVSRYLLPSLVTESSPLVRAYIEWIISIDLINGTGNRDALFEYFHDQSKPALVTSVERIAFMVAQKIPTTESKDFFDKFTQNLITNCTSNKPLIRHFSNSLILSVFPEIKAKGIHLPVHDVLEALYVEAKKSEVTGQYRSGDALIWDVEKDFTLTGIFGGVLSRISPRDVDIISQTEFKKYMGDDSLSVEIGFDQGPTWSAAVEENTSKKAMINSPLQTKSGAWESVIDLDEKTRSIKRSELIVVSSLVDKPPNLGGICRLCDVLGAGLMTVDDLRVKKHPQFKNVAVTADYWMPITEVKIEDIPSFMKAKKKEGYTLIGLEQTDQSIVLGKDTPFPAKSLILIGKEAEGIPGELLAELDYCVEIRQMGVVRSMNIQTATAVIVHAYSSSQVHN